ncbi:MAG: peptidase [Proteobacteria bacterium]|nr:peptidase [Pseudomonadota bacterium]
MRTVIRIALFVAAFQFAGCGGQNVSEDQNKIDQAKTEGKMSKDAEQPIDLLNKFAPTEIGVAVDRIPAKHRPVFKKLIEAAKILDGLFLQQVDGRNEQWRAEIAGDPKLVDTLATFDVMYGPWNRLEHNEAFWGDVEKPKGASYYPQDMTKKEFEDFIAAHPEQKSAFTGYFTLIRRDGEGKLQAVPYAEAYKEQLEPAATLLKEAAALTDDPRLKKYLESRAAAFSSNEYRQSDMDWMDLGDGDLEVVIGPYEVYEDELFGYKAAFEAFITLRDPEDSATLDSIKALIPEMEAYLPIPDEHKNPNRGTHSPISVVDLLYNAGDCRSAVQTLAFNLPNDEVVRETKGSKKVLLKNVAQAKYDKILVPIAGRMMRADQAKHVTFNTFFGHSLVHEISHGVGPGKITVERDGKQVETTVNEELKELYPGIEEAKADILGVYLKYMLNEKGVHPTSEDELYASLLGGFFRSVRFGVGEAHGQANMIQLNWFMEKGAVVIEDGKYVYVTDKMKEAVTSLSTELLMIEAMGDYGKAKELIDKYAAMPPELEKVLDGLDDIPTDIRPVYPAEKQMAGW